jgi:hypothetical protein
VDKGRPPVGQLTGVIHRALRSISKAVLPAQIFIAILAIRARRHKHRLNAGWGLCALSKQLGDRFRMTVQGGPFAGLRLPPAALAEHLGPSLMGTCECELHGAWLSLTTADVPLVVNVGSSFGYYAAGLARRFGCRAVAFDPDPWARRATRDIAKLNGLSIATHALCSRAWLERMTPGALLVMDCEGYEAELLRAPVPAALAHSVLAIELHEHLRPGSDRDIQHALAPTHVIERVASRADTPEPPVDLTFLDEHNRALACQEIRTPQSWLVCRPRAASRA